MRLWRDWCRVWPEQYGHESLSVRADGYDPVFDVIPSQAYKDFYLEVVCDHPVLRGLNPFEVVDAALNQTRAPESQPPRRSAEHARVASVDIDPQQSPPDENPQPEADTA